MVVLYVGGNRIGTWAEAEHLVADLAARQKKIELRDETGQILGNIVPVDPWPDQAELDRRCSEEGGMSLAEFWKKMGVE